MKPFILGLLLAVIHPCLSTSQTFDFKDVANPTHPNFNRIVLEQEDFIFLTFFDANFSETLFRYDGSDLTEVTLPAGYTFGNTLLVEDDGKAWLQLNNANFIGDLAILEDGVFTVYEDPDDLFAFAFEQDGIYYFEFFNNATYETEIKSFAGQVFEPFVTPGGSTFETYIGNIGNEDYLIFNDWGNLSLYTYNAGAFTLIEEFSDSFFPAVLITEADKVYISLFDYYFNQLLAVVTSDGAELVPAPAGFGIYNGVAVNFKGDNYFGWNDDNFDNSTLFRLESNNDWTTIPNPTGLQLGNVPFNVEFEDLLYMSYNDQNFVGTMVIFDGNTFEVITNPANTEFSGYLTDFKGGVFLRYFEQYSYEGMLMYYDGVAILPVPNQPADIFFGYETTAIDRIFFTYRDYNFNFSLFFIKDNTLPTSADTSITIPNEMSYQFSPSDFVFTDVDEEDVFSGIQVESLPSEGILHLAGAQINPADIINVSDFGNLNYVPFTAGVGTPFDSFKFRVWDGSNVSEESYTMNINIVEVTGTEDILTVNLKVFPNPANDWLRVSIDQSNLAENTMLLIADAKGQIIENINTNEAEINIAVDQFPVGNYYLILRNEALNQVQKFIVGH